MSHLAIARKWRPQVFESIVGQSHVTRTLQNAIRLDRVHHAFLFTGARGVGKTTAARVLARALNCETGPGAINPCNECTSCVEMLSGSYPDVVEIDAASHNSVDDIRDLVEKARYTPQRGRVKVYIIDEVHMVTKQGFNALLKTLEEPPPHVRFILATTDPQKLLDTVISRCQRFDFKMIPVRTVYEHLAHVAEKEGVQIPTSALMSIAREGGGSMRDAQSLLDQVLSFSEGSVTEEEVAEILGFIDRSILYDALESSVGGDAARALEVVGRVRLYGYDVRAFSGQLLEAVRNVLVVNLVENASTLMDLPDEEIARLRALAKGRDASLIRQQFDVLAEAVDAIARSEQPMLLLETALVKMAHVRPFVPIDALLGRLEQLESRLAKAGVRPGPPPGQMRAPAPKAPAFQATRPADPAPARTEAPRPAPRAEVAPPKPEPPKPKPPTPAPAPPAPPTPVPAPPKPAPTSESRFSAPRVAKAPPLQGGALASIGSYSRDSAPKPSAPPAPPKPSAPQARPEPPPPAPRAPIHETTLLKDLSAPKAEAATQIRVDPTRPDPPGNDWVDARKWRQFVHGLQDDESLTVARGHLARAGFVEAGDDTITIGFYSAVTLRSIKGELTDPALAEALRDSFGRAVTLEPVLDEEKRSGRSLAEEHARIRTERTEQLRLSALSHPAVEATEQVFPGASVLGEPRVPPIEEIVDVQ